MPTTLYWIGGSGPQSWSNTANWSASPGGASAGVIPATGDTVWVANGTSFINQGLSQSGVTLAALYIGFSGTIGSVGNHLDIRASQMKIYGSPQNIFIYAATAGTSEIYVNTGSTVYLIGDGGTGIANSYFGARGRIVIDSSCDLESCSLVSMGATIEILRAEDPSVAEDDVDITMYGGECLCYRRVGVADIRGGRLSLFENVIALSIIVGPNAVYNHQSTGNLGSVLVHSGGKASASSATSPFTVTSSTVEGTGDLFTDSAVAITYTATPTRICPQ